MMRFGNLKHGLYSLFAFGVFSFYLLSRELYSTFPSETRPVQKCAIPNYDPHDPITRPFVRILPPFSCLGEPWVTHVVGNTVVVDKALLQRHGESIISCSYQTINRVTDDKVSFSEPIAFGHNFTPKADFIRTECQVKSQFPEVQLYKSYHNIMREKPELEHTLQQNLKSRKRKLPGPAEHSHGQSSQEPPRDWMNVVFIGIDSISRFSTIRLMPRLRNFLSQNLHGIELTNYNKVGDNTFPNIMGLMTGKKVGEDMSDMLSTFGLIDREVMDKQGHHFLWDDFHDAGYRTLYIEDDPSVSTFNWNKGSGFRHPPTDYYFRTMAVAKEQHSGLFSKRGVCFAGFPNDVLLLNYTLDFCRLFHDRPHFALTFLVTSTHGDINGGSRVDGYHEQFLSTMLSEGLLNNTLLLYFSDHGVRGLRSATGFRKTPMGKFEEMRPFMFLAFPPWFRKAYPHLFERAQANAARLTTHLDVHATILDVLHLHHQDPLKAQRPTLHGISLFKEIPSDRTCVDAGIPLPYCVCLKDHPLPTDSALAKEAGEALIAALNNIQKNVQDKCHTLTLHEISGFHKVEEGGKYLDLICGDGWLLNKSLYRVIVSAQPGGGVFEGTLSKCSRFTPFEMHGEVNRLNLYGNSSVCVNSDRVLKKICLCKDLKSQNR